MSELFAAPADPQVVVEDPEHVIEAVSRPPVVITEQAVAFSTAAAVALPRTKPTRRVIAALRGMFLSSSEDARPARRHYPPRRDAFLEQAAITREIQRLPRQEQAVVIAHAGVLALLVAVLGALGGVGLTYLWSLGSPVYYGFQIDWGVLALPLRTGVAAVTVLVLAAAVYPVIHSRRLETAEVLRAS